MYLHMGNLQRSVLQRVLHQSYEEACRERQVDHLKVSSLKELGTKDSYRGQVTTERHQRSESKESQSTNERWELRQFPEPGILNL